MKKGFNLSLLTLLVLGMGTAQAQDNPQKAPADKAPPVVVPTQTTTAQQASSMGLPDFTQVVRDTENAVVNIRTMETLKRGRGLRSFGGNGDADEMFRFFFGPDFAQEFGPFGFEGPGRGAPPADGPEKTVPAGVGSGFIIDKEGYIITNSHVVDGASEIIVTLNNGKEHTAKVVGSDKRTDIALIKIESKDKDLTPLKIGSASQLQKGEWVLAIGSPFDLDSTVTSGIVSAINRDTGDYLPFIQTDVAVNPGNSGGPLINLKGEAIGVNSQIISRSGGFMGISLSIPIDEAMKVVKQLKETGKVTRGKIGVAITEISDDLAKALKLPDNKGALVSRVEEGSPSEHAGIQAGDVITEFNGKKIIKWSDLPRLVGQTEPGQTATVKLWRLGKVIDKKITIENLNPDQMTASRDGSDDGDKAKKADRLGVKAGNVPSQIKQKLGLKGGVIVTGVDGIAAQEGLRPDDIILVVNNSNVQDLAHYNKLVKSVQKGQLTALLIRRENMVQWVTLTPEK